MENLAFWSIAAAMAAGVATLLVLASLRARGPAEPATGRDMQIYRDQLADVERDMARGTLDPAEAQRLRAEIARRLLGADRTAQGPTAPQGARAGLLPALLIVVAIGGALALYARIGLPWYPDMPIAPRLAEADAELAARPSQADYVANLPPALPATPDADYAALLDKLRAAVDPATATDPIGLALLVQNEAGLRNFAPAIAAQRRLITVKGDTATAEDHSTLARLMIEEAGGYVSPEAETALVAALQKDPRDGWARYFSGLMFAQFGRFDRAFALWQPLLAESPPEAPWVAAIRADIEEVASLAGVDYSLPALRGPSAEDMAAAADMSAEDRMAMVEGMVAQLSERLNSEGGTAAEWAQLIGALGVLGRTDEAAAIYAEAKGNFTGRAADLATLAAAAQAAGLAP
jgi:cytochrome c-type biogenesis protein CcmH